MPLEKENRNRRKACYAIFSAAMLAFTLSCQSVPKSGKKMTVSEASQLAVTFEGKYQTPPPRGFGGYVQLYVDRYRSLEPGVLEKCSQPRHRMTDKEIRKAGRAKRGHHFLRRFAEEAFFDGSAEAAIRLSSGIVHATRKSSHKSIAMAYKAFFLAQGGDPDAAATALNHAWRHYNVYRKSGHGGENDYWGEIVRYDIFRAKGAIALAEGDLKKAEARYYQALGHFNRAYELAAGAIWELPQSRKAIVQSELARILRMQGRLNEAEIWAREAMMEDDYRVKPLAMMSLAEIYFARRESEMARQLALAARNLIIDRCVSVESLSRAAARALYARTLMALSQWKAAVAEFEMIEKEMAPDPKTFARSFRDDTDWGLALAMAGRADAAVSQLGRAGKRAARRYGRGHYNVLEAEALAGVALAAAGHAAAALGQLDGAVPGLLARWKEAGAESPGHAFRKQKLRLIIEAYITLLTAGKEPGRVEKAFALAGMLQARSVGRSLAASAARTAVNDPALALLIRQRQDLEIRADAFQGRLAQAMETAAAQVLEQCRNELAELNGAIAALDGRIRSQFPRYAAIIHPGALGVADLREHMKPGEAVIAFFVGAQRSFVWAFGPAGPVAFAAVPLEQRALTHAIGHLRKALDPKSVGRLGDIPDFDVTAGHGLYRALLDPVADGWRNAKSLLVIPDGPIGQLPLSVLPVAADPLPRANGALFANHRAVAWLARTHAVTLLPSPASLAILRTLPRGNPGRRVLAAFGDPVFRRARDSAGQMPAAAPLASRGSLHRRGIRIAGKTPLDDENLSRVDLTMLQPLPDTAAEIIGIAEALGADPDTDVFLGEKASEGTVRAMALNDRQVLVFATHGLVPGDLDGLREPALALSAPGATGERDNDGLLTMGEVMGLSLDADWVVLSACNTAAGDGAGAEAVSGLGQAFFYAGARSLLVTGWPVETTSARILTTDLFRRQKENPSMNRALALQETMNAMMDATADKGFSYAHPLFWAPYMLVGSGG